MDGSYSRNAIVRNFRIPLVTILVVSCKELRMTIQGYNSLSNITHTKKWLSIPNTSFSFSFDSDFFSLE